MANSNFFKDKAAEHREEHHGTTGPDAHPHSEEVHHSESPTHDTEPSHHKEVNLPKEKEVVMNTKTTRTVAGITLALLFTFISASDASARAFNFTFADFQDANFKVAVTGATVSQPSGFRRTSDFTQASTSEAFDSQSSVAAQFNLDGFNFKADNFRTFTSEAAEFDAPDAKSFNLSAAKFDTFSFQCAAFQASEFKAFESETFGFSA